MIISEIINDILEKHENHPCVQEISQTFMPNKKFSFKFVTEDLVREEIMNLGGSKATPIGDISVDILKSTVDIHLPFITNNKFINQKRLFSKRITDLSVFYRMCQRFLKESCIIK